MANRPVSTRLKQKLRAHKLLPEGVAVAMERLGRGASAKGWRWHAIGLTGEVYCGSIYTMTEIADAKTLNIWTDEKERINVDPG